MVPKAVKITESQIEHLDALLLGKLQNAGSTHFTA
jgi:hypothetical protein